MRSNSVHGSRFSAFGDVICGPANCGMSRLGEHDASTRSSAPGGTKVEKKEKKADQASCLLADRFLTF